MVTTSSFPLPLIDLAGSPRERGRQYGTQTRDLIHQSLEFYERAIQVTRGVSWRDVTTRAARWVDPCTRFAPDLMEEVEAIAEGAGVDTLDVMALNARGEILYDKNFAALPPYGEADSIDGCTSFALLSEASDGHVYAGQNWDWQYGVAPTLVVLRISSSGRPTVVMHAEAGQIGRQGANSLGIAFNANGLGGRFGEEAGVPQTFIRRRVLDSPSLVEALGVLEKTPQQICSNALVTHRDGFAIDVETTPGPHGWMYPTDGLLVHGNHFEAFRPPQLANTYRVSSVDSLYRVPRARAILDRARLATSPDEVRAVTREAMSDHFGYPESVCTHPEMPGKPKDMQYETVLSNCVDLTTGDYYLTAGPPCQSEYSLVPWNLYDTGADVEADAARTAVRIP